jgi:hypothetical protein
MCIHCHSQAAVSIYTYFQFISFHIQILWLVDRFKPEYLTKCGAMYSINFVSPSISHSWCRVRLIRSLQKHLLLYIYHRALPKFNRSKSEVRYLTDHELNYCLKTGSSVASWKNLFCSLMRTRSDRKIYLWYVFLCTDFL